MRLATTAAAAADWCEGYMALLGAFREGYLRCPPLPEEFSSGIDRPEFDCLRRLSMFPVVNERCLASAFEVVFGRDAWRGPPPLLKLLPAITPAALSAPRNS